MKTRGPRKSLLTYRDRGEHLLLIGRSAGIMEPWQRTLFFLIIGVILAFPAAILISVVLGWVLMKWEKTRLWLYLKKRSLREGKVIVRWPAKDIKEEVMIVDLSKLNDNLVGVKRRRYNMMNHPMDPPSFGELEFLGLREVFEGFHSHLKVT